ncbi:MAG: QueT transporter family protein [Oscillospiraceae bacterium]
MSKFSGNITVKKLAALGLVAALYAALTVGLSFMSYMGVQFRVAEALMLLCFYRREYVLSMTVGCFLANLFSPMALDMVFGTAATLIAALLMTAVKNRIAASLLPMLVNALVVGFELWYFVGLPLWLSCGQVALGEFVCVSILGTVLFRTLEKKPAVMRMLCFGEEHWAK